MTAPRRRWWLVGAAVVVAVLVAGVVLVGPHRLTGRPVPAPIGTPADLLVSVPLDRPLVAGWHASATALGLPPGVGVGSVFATVGDTAYVATSCDLTCPDPPTSWVYGIDIRTGAGVFAPAALTGAAPSCSTNGPSVAVCVTATDPAVRKHRVVSVLDLRRGEVTFTGPTRLDSYGVMVPGSDPLTGPEPTLAAVGNYRGQSRLVARVQGKGVYGIGSHGELTWFLPGSGQVLVPKGLAVSNIPPLTNAVQGPSRTDPRFRVFSALDGTDLTPDAPAGTAVKRATTYNGGFAYQYEDGTSAGVLFYDTTGRLINRRPAEAYPILVDNPAMPIILDNGMFRVYTAGGDLLASIPGQSAYTQSPLFESIGTKLYEFVAYARGEHWKPWDLRTGEPGAACRVHLSDYVGAHGDIALTADEYGMFVATDTATCRTVWKTPTRDGMIQQVGTALIRTAREEIVSLRPPP